MTATAITVDATDVVPNAGQLVVTFTVQKSGAAYNLTGKTVTATVRPEDAEYAIINTALEAHAMALLVAASGTCTLTLSTTEMGYMDAPESSSQVSRYLVKLRVVEDDYRPYPYRLFIRRA